MEAQLRNHILQLFLVNPAYFEMDMAEEVEKMKSSLKVYKGTGFISNYTNDTYLINCDYLICFYTFRNSIL